ncbi:N-acetylmuramoyl-L-alanine amidase CwlD [Paenibacillus thermotolerans]|uniref:N-acetylmuramoyl-L-alanine amidase CwlD n=1 Tax=Paenibacillus thermotolerans TaxID=3027807 RepID=UPI002368ABB4|nr:MULTISPECIES: N-acetylmuramoyl-L-alanine amidase CwlD [unclassified Paenibacillus]
MKKRKRIVIWITGAAKTKIITTALMAALLVYVFTNQLPADKTWTYWTLPLSGKIIALDPGHGGPDGGANSRSGLVEKDITLAISLYLRDYLQQAGAVVVMTRETDTDLAPEGLKGYSKRKTYDLKAREKLVAESGASSFLSIHLNAIPSSRWYGPQTFYTNNHEDNKRLALFIQDEIKNNVINTDRRAKRIRNIYLMDQSKVPSALIEVGFLSNPEEAAKLGNPDYQKKMAAAIYRGFLRYASGEKISGQKTVEDMENSGMPVEKEDTPSIGIDEGGDGEHPAP